MFIITVTTSTYRYVAPPGFLALRHILKYFLEQIQRLWLSGRCIKTDKISLPPLYLQILECDRKNTPVLIGFHLYSDLFVLLRGGLAETESLAGALLFTASVSFIFYFPRCGSPFNFPAVHSLLFPPTKRRYQVLCCHTLFILETRG